MRLVERAEILDLVQYELVRDELRQRTIEQKRRRRVALGSNMTALFENHATVLFQIQEMLRTERIVKEPAILHELETYNELIPRADELSATIFVEYPDAEERDRKLVELAGLEQHFYIEILGRRARGRNETRGTRTDRTTAVHYVKFPLLAEQAAAVREGVGAVILGVDHPSYLVAVELSSGVNAELRADLS